MSETNNTKYETVKIRKTANSCSLCEDYCERNADKPVAVISCEGSCLRGEIARRAADRICHALAPDKTVRVCLGSAFTKDTGQRALVQKAAKVLAVEGCFVRCGSRMMEGVVEGFEPEVVLADKLCQFDTNLFGTNELPSADIDRLADQVAEAIDQRL